MNLRILAAAGALIFSGALGAQQASPDPYADFNKQVQEKLHQLGFYAGPVNGDFGPYTQAALAQFQLSILLPVSGMLDEQTVAALDIEQNAEASAGPSGDTGRERVGNCDALVGPEKDQCLKQGGTVEASATRQ